METTRVVPLPEPQGAADRALAVISELGRVMTSSSGPEEALAAAVKRIRDLVRADSGEVLLFEESPNGAVEGAERQEVRRILSVPLVAEGRPIGVLRVSATPEGEFTAEASRLLAFVAPQIALLAQAARTTRQLRRRNFELERIVEIHGMLGELVLGGHDRAEVVERLEALLGRPVAVAEVSGHLVASGMPASASRAVLHVLSDLDERAALDQQPVHLSSAGRELLVIPIAAGGELLGCVAAAASQDEVGPLGLCTLRQAALVFALEMVKAREVHEVERRLHASVVHQLLLAESDAEAEGLLRRLGIEPGQPLWAGRLALALDDQGMRFSHRFQAQQARLQRGLSALLGHAWPGAIAVVSDDGIDLVLPGGPEARSERTRRLEDVMRQLGHLGGPVRPVFLGVGSPATTAMDLRRSFQEAGRVVAGRSLLAGRRVVHVEEMGVLRLLAEPVGSADLDRYLEAVLAPLLERRDAGADWLPFFRVLVACNFSAKAAARRLGVHVNTARYRADRIEELLGVDFASSQDRFNLQLALQILDTREALAGGGASG